MPIKTSNYSPTFPIINDKILIKTQIYLLLDTSSHPIQIINILNRI